MSTEYDPRNPKSYVAQGEPVAAEHPAELADSDDGPGHGRGHHPTNTGAVLREIEMVKPAEHERGHTTNEDAGLDAKNAREHGVDTVGDVGAGKGSERSEDSQNGLGVGHGPAAAALAGNGHGHNQSSTGGFDPTNSPVNPSNTYARGHLPPPKDGEVFIGGDPENPREAMAYEPSSATSTDEHGSDSAKTAHPKGGVSDKVVGKVQHAAGVLFGNEGMKAKGTERETRAAQKGTGSENDVHSLEQEDTEVQRKRSEKGPETNLDRKKMAGLHLV